MKLDVTITVTVEMTRLVRSIVSTIRNRLRKRTV